MFFTGILNINETEKMFEEKYYVIKNTNKCRNLKMPTLFKSE